MGNVRTVLVTIANAAASCGYGAPSGRSPTSWRTDMNESTTDRVIRFVAGAALLIVGFTVLSGALAVAAIVPGLILVVTGPIGLCPIYALLNISTRKATDA